MACNKCVNGMITEVDGSEVFKWRCDCKTPEFWERQQQESRKRWEERLKAFEGSRETVGV